MTALVVDGLVSASADRQAAIRAWFASLRPGMTVALSTHINADGDGCGSESALARLLAQCGIRCRIVNPTPWPTMFAFLLGNDVVDLSAKGAAGLAGIDALVVLDINDRRRLGQLAEAVRALEVPVSVIDHHLPGDEPVGGLTIASTRACATGELVYDIAVTLGLEITPAIAQSLYAAILTDTGSFRFSNTSPRAHAIAAALLAAGVNPEEMYRRIYAQVSVGRLRLLREALGSLQTEPELGLSHISVAADVMDRFDVTSEELDGIVEHPRSIAGTRLAVFFRDLGYGKVKVSFRSTGDVNVQQLASRYGGGGHAKASGAMLTGGLEEVQAQVLADAREFLRGAAVLG
ncbi:MAG: DHH family phosphoesterase [Gemmatimonas sp.]|jgi:phosphoesterase RecJ-like protein|uniref:DHH family phosphoesterase n=1 Tax=Gemmatimonas sp. TaxID=1962908 RepID=UPI00391F27AB|nr:bifunctional oligoribonuclease/PAP phosphatase NrnA [Gemmatimonadota bacterium]